MPSTRIMTRGARTIIKQAYAGHRLTLWLLICVISVLSAGCPTAVQYQPNEGIVDTLGVVPARQRLQEIVARSVNPQVTESEVTDDFLQYRFRQAVAGFPTGAILENRIHFLNVGRLEVFENNLVIIRTAGGLALARFFFWYHTDVINIIHILYFFRGPTATVNSKTRSDLPSNALLSH